MDIRKKIEAGEWCVGYHKESTTGVGGFYLMNRISARATWADGECQEISLMGRVPIVNIKGTLKGFVGKVFTLDEIRPKVEAELIESLLGQMEKNIILVIEKKKLYGRELESIKL